MLEKLNIAEFVDKLSAKDVPVGAGSASALAGLLGAGMLKMAVNCALANPSLSAQREILLDNLTQLNHLSGELTALIDRDAAALAELFETFTMQVPKLDGLVESIELPGLTGSAELPGFTESTELPGLTEPTGLPELTGSAKMLGLAESAKLPGLTGLIENSELAMQKKMEDSLLAAAKVPLQTAAVCLKTLQIALNLATLVETNLKSELMSAVICAHAGATSAVMSCAVNLSYLKDESFSTFLAKEIQSVKTQADEFKYAAEKIIFSGYPFNVFLP